MEKTMNRKAFHLASEYSNREYKDERKLANRSGIVHKPRWRQYTPFSRRYRKFLYSQIGPIAFNIGEYKQ